MLFGELLMARFGWRPFFVVLGLASLLWLLPWLEVDANEPRTGPTDVSVHRVFPNFFALAVGFRCMHLFSAICVTISSLPGFPLSRARPPLFHEGAVAKIGGWPICGRVFLALSS